MAPDLILILLIGLLGSVHSTCVRRCNVPLRQNPAVAISPRKRFLYAATPHLRTPSVMHCIVSPSESLHAGRWRLKVPLGKVRLGSPPIRAGDRNKMQLKRL